MRARFDSRETEGRAEDVNIDVVEAVADVAGVSPTELPALAEFADPDSIEAFVRTDNFTGVIDFDYDGYRVRVTDEGEVTVGNPIASEPVVRNHE